MAAVESSLRWMVVTGERGPYRFPDEPSPTMLARWSVPAVYRWAIEPSCDAAMYYLGETGALGRRVETDLRSRVGDRLREERSLGATIRLEVLDLAALEGSGQASRWDLETVGSRRRLLARVEEGLRAAGAQVVTSEETSPD